MNKQAIQEVLQIESRRAQRLSAEGKRGLHEYTHARINELLDLREEKKDER